MKNPDGVKASIKVTVTKKPYEIKSVAKLDKKEVAYGTAATDLGLPTEVEVSYTDGTKRNSKCYMEYRQLRWK